MRIGFIFAGTALIAFLPAFQVSAQSFDGRLIGSDRQVGYRLDPATVAYVRGGHADARIEPSASALISSESEYRDSWTLGAGIERKVLKKISARLEYRYSDLGEGDGAFDRHRFLAGIAYRF